MLARSLSASLAFALAACSGVSPGVPGSPVPLAPSGAHFAPAKAKAAARATMRILVPPRPKRRRYVSPSTKSVAILVMPRGGGPARSFNQNLTASSPGCEVSSQGTLCTLSLVLVPGAYTAAFTTYDGTLNSSGEPTGSVLSGNQSVPLTITQAASNIVTVTLGGIPAYFLIAPADPAAMIATGSNGFTLSKCATPQEVTIVPTDIDHNPIVGPGAPVLGVQSSDPAHLAVTVPPSTAPSTYTLREPNLPVANSTASLTLTATPAASSGGTAIKDQVEISFNGDICGILSEFTIPTSGSRPLDIAAGADGALWFTEAEASQIGRITTAGVVTKEYPTLSTASVPAGIVEGPDGAMWFAENKWSQIGRLTTAGSMQELPTKAADEGPFQIVVGPDDNLWYTQANVEKVGTMTVAGQANDYGGLASSSSDYSIATGPDGALWVTEPQTDQFARMTAAGVVTNEFTTSDASAPGHIASGPDGNIWYTEGTGRVECFDLSTSTITPHQVPSESGDPTWLTAGPDGAVWVSETGAGKILRVTTGTPFSMTEYSIPTPNAQPEGITVGPDGAIWFVEFNGNKIGRLQ